MYLIEGSEHTRRLFVFTIYVFFNPSKLYNVDLMVGIENLEYNLEFLHSFSIPSAYVLNYPHDDDGDHHHIIMTIVDCVRYACLLSP